MSKKLYRKNTFVIDGTSQLGKEIVRSFLQEGATVIVPSDSANKIDSLKKHVKDIKTGHLITFLTDLHNFNKASDVSDILREIYGQIDLTVAVMENEDEANPFLNEIKISEIQKTVQDNITTCLICSQIFLNHLDNQKCVFITITKESDGFKVNPVSKLLSNIQNCIAQMIGEETNKIKARYFHLFIDKNKDSALNSELIGQQIIKTYLNNDNAASETIIHI